MAAGYTELFLEQGATFNTTITLDDVSGTAMNLVGYTASSQMKKSYYSSNSSATFNATTGGVNGTVTLNLGAAATANVYPGRYLYDVYVTDESGTTRTRVLEGIVNVSPQVTKTPGML
jgi:hypothetical protein